MAAISIGIDLCHKPLLVSCKFTSTILIQEGSKEAKFKSDGDGQEEPSSQELSECFKDVYDVAKSFFGSPKIARAVVVVPNDLDDIESIKQAAKRALIPIHDIVPEHIAVAAVFAYKAKPTKRSPDNTITIISGSAGACDMYRVSVYQISGEEYGYTVVRHKSHGVKAKERHEMPDDEGEEEEEKEEEEVEDDLSRRVIFIKYDEPKEEAPPAFEKVVFAGNSAELVNMRDIINSGFTLIKEWKDPNVDSAQMAAYGATVLTFLKRQVSIRG